MPQNPLEVLPGRSWCGPDGARCGLLQAHRLAAGVALALAFWGPGARAQAVDAAGPSRAWAIQPQVSVTQTLSSNYRLTAVDPAYDAITRLSAGVSLNGHSGLLRGFLDYSLSGLIHARHSDRNTHQNALNTALTANLAEGRAQVDLGAGISQSAVSAFGAQPSNDRAGTDNITEVRNLRLAPSFRGPLGPGLRYTAALTYAVTSSSRSTLGDSSTGNLAVHVEPSTAGRLGWSVDGSHLDSSFKAGRTTQDDRLFGSLRWRLDDLDLQLAANAGTESTNLASLQRESRGTWGLSGVWSPSPVTRVSGEWEKRFFGNSHAFSVEHRTPLTVWRVTDSRSLNTGGSGASGGGRGTVFDLFFTQFASIEPDPIKRADLVNAFLRSNGIDPNLGLDPSYLRSSATVQDRQEFSVALRGVRSTATLVWTRSNSRRVQVALNLGDDLDNGGQVHLRQLSLDLSHRLTPLSTLSLVLNRQQGTGNLAAQRNLQRAANLLYTTRLTVDTSFSLGLRRALYANSPGPFNESALFATYGLRF